MDLANKVMGFQFEPDFSQERLWLVFGQSVKIAL